jgi:hypothetical protein
MDTELRGFLLFLQRRLGEMAVAGRDYNIRWWFMAIENGEDDTAYVATDDEVEFHIVLDDRMPLGMVIDYLIHELAHIHSWHHYEGDDHGPEFGKSQAYLYREYLKLYDFFWGYDE